MRRLLALALAAAVVGSFLGVVRSKSAADSDQWVKFLFTPQAGLNSVCLSCGWHDGACWAEVPGSALDFPGSCADTETVYFRSFGFNRLDYAQMSAYGTAFEDASAICKTNYVRIYDTGSNILGTMWYTHTYLWSTGGSMMMLAIRFGTWNESAFAGMAKEPGDETVPEEQWENQECYDQGLTTGVHLHEESADGASMFLLNYDRYPTVPGSGGPYDPQDWQNDWARALCINDTDCDDWTDDDEDFIGTDPLDACPDGSWDDAWPPDINNDASVNVMDVLLYKGKLQHCQPDPAYDPRYDLTVDGCVNVIDVLLFKPVLGSICTNP